MDVHSPKNAINRYWSIATSSGVKLSNPWRIHGAGIYANINGVNLDGIHGTPYIAAPWIRHGKDLQIHFDEINENT